MKCPKCNTNAELVDGAVVYPHRSDLMRKKFWRCPQCPDVRVGCHPGTTKPLGFMADAATRAARQRAHAAFDPLWLSLGGRNAAYAWLARELAIEPEHMHIGHADEALCERIIELCALAIATRGFQFSMELT